MGVLSVNGNEPNPYRDEYNNEPIFYCKQCLSLEIRTSDDIDYCGKCGRTEINKAHIDDWETLYMQKYGNKYLLRK